MSVPVFYKYQDNLMTEQEALDMVERRLFKSCGDLMLDIEYLESLDKLNGVR